MGRGGDRPEFRPDNLAQWEAVGIPFAVEGYGLIYNKQVLDKATNGNFDPSSIGRPPI